MNRNRSFLGIAAGTALVALTSLPAFAAGRGTADFTRFVVLGDSYGAGVSSSSLNAAHQQYSWPAVIARQAHAPDFVQPLVSEPGIGAELQLLDVVKYPPTVVPKDGQGQPTNSTFPRPYNNLSIPGAIVSDLTTLTGKENPTSTAKLFAQFILRGLGTPVDQALAEKPTFIAIWIGGNDALGAVLGGTPKLLNTVDNFRTAYNAMLDKLVAGAPNAGMVVGTLPTHVAAAPVANTVPPFIVNPATRGPVLGPDGKPVYYVADLGDGNFGQLPAGSMVLLSASTRLATGYGIPAAFKTIPPFNALPDVGKPLPDTDVLTPTEIAAIETRANEFNAVITQSAAAHNVPVANISGLFDRALAGFTVGPISLSSAYITGGIFSYDGFHMTDLGYTLFADEYIKTINANYDTHIPLASVATFLANNGATATTSSGMPVFVGMSYEMSKEAEQSIRDFIPEIPKASRLRTTSH